MVWQPTVRQSDKKFTCHSDRTDKITVAYTATLALDTSNNGIQSDPVSKSRHSYECSESKASRRTRIASPNALPNYT